jgi:hypothetical protein
MTVGFSIGEAQLVTTSELIELIYAAVPDASRRQVFLDAFVRYNALGRVDFAGPANGPFSKPLEKLIFSPVLGMTTRRLRPYY